MCVGGCHINIQIQIIFDCQSLDITYHFSINILTKRCNLEGPL